MTSYSENVQHFRRRCAYLFVSVFFYAYAYSKENNMSLSKKTSVIAGCTDAYNSDPVNYMVSKTEVVCTGSRVKV